MGFTDVLNNFKKDIGLCYQSQKNVVDVAQRYIGELEKAYEGGGSGGGINYSTTEQDTGLTWIDGKKIYQKTVDFGALPDNVGTGGDSKTVNHSISNVSQFISIEGIAVKSSPMTAVPIPNTNVYTLGSAITITVTDTGITIKTASNKSDLHGYVTLKYTKSA